MDSIGGELESLVDANRISDYDMYGLQGDDLMRSTDSEMTNIHTYDISPTLSTHIFSSVGLKTVDFTAVNNLLTSVMPVTTTISDNLDSNWYDSASHSVLTTSENNLLEFFDYGHYRGSESENWYSTEYSTYEFSDYGEDTDSEVILDHIIYHPETVDWDTIADNDDDYETDIVTAVTRDYNESEVDMIEGDEPFYEIGDSLGREIKRGKAFSGGGSLSKNLIDRHSVSGDSDSDFVSLMVSRGSFVGQNDKNNIIPDSF